MKQHLEKHKTHKSPEKIHEIYLIDTTEMENAELIQKPQIIYTKEGTRVIQSRQRPIYNRHGAKIQNNHQ